MRRFGMAAFALASLGVAAGAQAATRPAAETPPALPSKEDVKAESVANAVRRYLNGDEQIRANKPVQVKLFAIVAAKEGEGCGEIRLDATTTGAFSAPPATIRLETVESRLLKGEEARGCRLYGDIEDPKSLLDGPGVRSVTPTEELADPTRIAALFDAAAEATFRDVAAAGAIRRLVIAFGFTHTDKLELSEQTLMVIGLYQEPDGAPQFDFLKRIVFLDDDHGMAPPSPSGWPMWARTRPAGPTTRSSLRTRRAPTGSSP